MSLLSTLLRRASAEKTGEIVRYTLSDYLQQRVQAIGSMMFPGYATTATVGGRPVEQIENSYTGYVNGAYKNDSVVAACMRVRRDIFRQARFCWRYYDDGGPGRLFLTDELDLLQNPWPNGTSHELLTRMITDVDLAGNSYIVNEGGRLRWLRPDWVSIILSADPELEPAVDVKGYVYTPGGGNLEDGTVYLPAQMCHWAPIPDPIAQYRGMSWLTPAIREVQADVAATEHKLMFFRNGATMGPIFTLPKEISVEQFKDFVAAADAAHVGVQNAYRPVYVGGGADVTMGSATMQQLEFKATQGAGETRIAALAGVHPVLVGLSEGLAGSSLNAGNFNSARRSTADVTLWPLWQDVCDALVAFLDVPEGAELWIREREIPFLREDAKDQAEITKQKMLGIEAGIRAGYKPDALVEFFDTHDITVLLGEHSGLTSVQLLPPGSSPEDQAGAEDEYEAALEEARAVFGSDDDLERRYNRNQARIPKGFEGGGRFRGLKDRLVRIIKEWLDDPDDSDPLEEFNQRQLRQVAKDLGLLQPRQRANEAQLKTMLLKHARGDKTPDVDEPEKPTPTKAAPAKKAPAKKAAPKAEVLSDDPKVREVQIENKIRAAYADLQRSPGDWVAFADLREKLADVDRAEVDKALKSMAVQPGHHVIPWDNRKALTKRDRDASVRIGGDETHAIRIEDTRPRPLPDKPKTPAKKATPASYELAPGYRGATGRARHAKRDEVLLSLSEGTTPRGNDAVEALNALESMGYIQSDGQGWRLTDKGRDYVDGKPKPSPDLSDKPRTGRKPKGRDLSGDHDVALEAFEAGKVDGEWRPSGGIGRQGGGRFEPDAGGYQAHLVIAKRQGFDGRPRVLTPERKGVYSSADPGAVEWKRLEEAGGTKLYRGWGWGRGERDKLGTVMADEYLYGPLHAGGGLGIGSNMSTDLGAADFYASHDLYTPIPGGATRAFILPADAKVISYGDAIKRRDAYLAKLPDGPEYDAERKVYEDPGTFAMAQGFDAMRATSEDSINVKKGIEEWVIFNRSKLIAWDDNPNGAAEWASKGGPDLPHTGAPIDATMHDEIDAFFSRQMELAKGPARKNYLEGIAYLEGADSDLALDRLAKARREQEFAGKSTKVIDELVARIKGEPPPVDPEVPDVPHTVADLRLIAKQRGVKIPKGTKKAELLALLGLTRSAMAYFDDDYEYDEDEISRALDREQLHHYWTRGEGLAKWATHPHPWTALRNHLRKYVGQARANRMASQWFFEVRGYWSGSRKGKNPVGPG